LKLSMEVALTIFSSRWFHSNIVLLKNEFLYCSVSHWILSKDFVLFGSINRWQEMFLTQRKIKVVIDGDESEETTVDS
jgi:hypothetical protein